MATLFYQLVYGEGISTVILLWFTYEIMNSNQQNFLMSFFIGLLALTKSPLTLTFLPFLFVFLIKNRRQISWFSLILCLATVIIPSIIWKLFLMKYHIGYLKTSFAFGELVSRLPKPNMEFLSLAVKDAQGNAESFIYFGIVSFVLWILFSKKILEGLPAAFLLAGVCLYYSYYYAYGAVGDYGSFLRYIMPASLTLFYLGAIGFDALWKRIEFSKIPFVSKFIAGIFMAGLFIHKLF